MQDLEVAGHLLKREVLHVVPEADPRSEFEAMFRQTYDRMLAYALRRADPPTAEDAVAETYATAWRRIDDIPSDPLPWLFGIARRALANSQRSARRRARLAGRLAQVRTTPPVASDPATRLEDAVMVRSALGSLSGSDREILMLVGWEGLDNERAAVALGVSSQTFAVRLHRARRRLDAELQRLASATGDPDEGTGGMS